jgi:hypothetical protein
MEPHDQIKALKQALSRQFERVDSDRKMVNRQLQSAARRIVLLEISNRRLRLLNAQLAIGCILSLGIGFAAGWRLID